MNNGNAFNFAISHYENLPFEIPENWEWTTFEDIFEITMGQSPSGADINNTNGLEFHQGKLFFGNTRLRCSQIFTDKPTKIASPNSLIICVRAPVGDVNIIDREICIGRGLCALKPLGGISTNFMFFWMNYFKDIFEAKATGSTFAAISGAIIRNQFIPLPPLKEQQRILNHIQHIYDMLNSIVGEL